MFELNSLFVAVTWQKDVLVAMAMVGTLDDALFYA
jgi:hypothetical protein